MSHIQLQMPNSLYQDVVKIAKMDDTSVNEFINLAVSEKIHAMNKLQTLHKRAERGDREAFLAVLSKVSNQEPPVYDRLD